ncbi:MAG TPA: nitroreductase/quinone reductase family protein [Novosphingobium sp.]|nr:nitroreductase/quinone reductase family protein [Novosphingobium sp.]
MSGLRDHKKNYIRSGGVQGHIIDLREMNGPYVATHCLIRYIGRKSGRTRITPLFYGCIGGEIILVASFLGSEKHPKWYLNLLESDTIDFQIATQAFRGTWREAEGKEREKLWTFMVDNMPSYSDYQQKTERRFPIIVVQGQEAIPVFTEADLA